jgi:MATE family multidrug resistance protein
MQLVDTLMVARLGTDALAAVGSANLWSYTLATFIIGIVSCVSTFVAQSIGREQHENCGKYAWQGYYLAIVAGLLAVLFWPVTPYLFGIMGHSESVERLEIIYFQVRLVGFAFLAIMGAQAAFFQSINRPMIPTVMAIIGNVINIVLDYALIFGAWGFPRMEVAGAAWATNISLFLQCAFMMVLFLWPSFDRVYGTRRGWRPDPEKIGELFRIGWPAGMAHLLDVLNWGIFTSFIVGKFGDIALAAHNAALSLMHFSFMGAMSINQAIAPIVGQWIGRGNIARAKARAYTATRIAMVYMLAMGIIFAIAGGPILEYGFNADTEVVRIGRFLLLCAAVFQLFDAVNITLFGALRGAGDTRWIAWLTAFAAYGLFLPSALIFAFVLGWGPLGAWAGATIYIISLSAVVFWRFHSERWRDIRIFNADMTKPAELG